ncbi:hypothetical protein KS4_10000 [Poriferisphaera corsica]|uniref:Uncharacterized protein n=1 Tax=Poriferisphaera corsica TaxID=2528020 RepID=A0A517YRX0_9BACT|nr:hypothetical protein KS4_10000 [Poriferisphaera corsica]
MRIGHYTWGEGAEEGRDLRAGSGHEAGDWGIKLKVGRGVEKEGEMMM